MTFPQRHNTHILEQQSETYLRAKLPQEWTVNRPQNDYGVDFQLGIAEDGELRGLELIVQLKASLDSTNHENREEIRIRTTTYNYLRKLLTVVMFVKYVANENEAYWILLRDIPGPNDPAQETFTVHVPKENRLSIIDWPGNIHLIRAITNLKLGAVNG